MAPRDGQNVVWTGFPGPTHSSGDQGRVLSATEDYCQVLWTTGSQINRVEPVSNEHLSAAEKKDKIAETLDESLDFAGLSHTAVRQVVEQEGVQALVVKMIDNGTLWSLAQLSDDVTEFAQKLASTNPEALVIMGYLDDDDQDYFLGKVATHILFEAASSDD